MADVEYATSSYKTPLHHRIIASMPVKASWVDAESGKTVSVEGLTENVGESSALVNLETLPPVGSEVRLKIMEENKAIIFISHKLEEIFLLANVITVFRNGKKVAFSPTKDVDTNWVIRQMTGHEVDQNNI